MLKKRLLFIEDLYDFYLNKYKTSTHFDIKETGSPLVVQVHGKINFDKSEKDTEGLLPVHLQACHTNLNINGSNISDNVMTAALPSFSNRPILGYIHYVNGQPEFYRHNIHEDENGEIVYDEVPIGIVPESCNAQLVYDEDKKKTYCEVDGYIFEEYSKASEILQREEECPVSVELSIRELSYNAKDKYLDIEDFFFSGVTILGKTPEGEQVMPGMENSNIKLADFSAENNSLITGYESKLIEFQERLLKLESACFNTYHSEEGGNNTNMNLFEELLAKYNKTAEDVTFDYSELTNEELTAKFEEVFGEETNSDDNADDTDNSEGTDDTGSESSADDGKENEADDNSDNSEQFEKIVRTYEISHEDIHYALYQLLAEYEEADNEWYFINSVFDTHFTYENWAGDKIYGQNYTKDGDNVSFDGERYNLHRELLTDSEFAELQSMRSNYASLVEFKATTEQNELHAKREEILNKADYSVLAVKDEDGNFTNASFAELYSKMDEYSVEDLEKEAKVLLGEYALNGGKFSAIEEPKTPKVNSVKLFGNPNKVKKQSKYGNLKFH